MPVKKAPATPAKESTEPKQTVAKRAVQGVKSAPQKIMEHTLSAALNAVEKAAVQDVKRKAKRVERTAKKVAKKKQNIMVKKTAARSKTVSADIEQTSIITPAPTPKKEVKVKPKVNLKTKIKDKIKELITPEKEQIFYYDHRQQIALALLYAIIGLIVYGISELLNPTTCHPLLITALNITEILILAAFILTVIVVIFKPTLAVVNKEGIKIDHNQTLLWDDVELAEEKYTSYITRRPLIALHVTPDNLKKYHLTFMQVLCKNNVFTPFSIPMYAMRPKDAEAIRNAIKRHTKYEDNRN